MTIYVAPGIPSETTSNKDQNSGYAGLDASGKLKLSEMPTSGGALAARAGRASTLATPTLRDVVSVFDYGPSDSNGNRQITYSLLAGGTATISDGNGHVLSDVYSTLAAAQVDYPAATTLTQTVDAAAWQLGINQAWTLKEKLVGPAPANAYIWNTGIVIPTGHQALDIETHGTYTAIQYNQASGSVIYCDGTTSSTWSGIKIYLSHSAPNGVVVFDVDAKTQFTGPISFMDCLISTATNVSNIVGYRYGHAGTGSGMDGFTHWRCYINFYNNQSLAQSPGCIGYVNEHTNGQEYRWYGCGVSTCAIGWSTHSTAGAGSPDGSGTGMFWYGCETANAGITLNCTSGGAYYWSGGHSETSVQFLQVPGGGTTAQYHITIAGTSWAGNTTAAAGRWLEFQGGGSLIVESCDWYNPTNTVGASWLYLNTRGTVYCRVKGCTVQNSDPFYTWAGQGTAILEIEGNATRNSDGQGGTPFTPSQMTNVSGVTTGYTAGSSTAVTIDGKHTGNVALASPAITRNTAQSGGSFAAGNAYYKVTAINAAGESLPSTEVGPIAVTLNQQVWLMWGPVSTATGYKIYRSSTSGTEGLIATLGNVNEYFDLGTATPGAAPPGTNTATTGYTLGDIVTALKKARIVAI